MRKIPDLNLALASLISLQTSSGTGFIYRSDIFLYLVTAKHVLFDDAQNLRATEIEMLGQTLNIDDEEVYSLNIDLTLAKHKYHKNNDVAVVQIAKIVNITEVAISENIGPIQTVNISYLEGVILAEKGRTNPTLCSKISTSHFKNVYISNDIYISGYPTSLGIQTSKQFDNTKPLLRKGIVANIYKETKTIILDCPVYGGNSGGPVIQVQENPNGLKEFKVIGVVSQFIPFVQKWKNERDRIIHLEYLNSGYSVATSFDCVIELIKSME